MCAGKNLPQMNRGCTVHEGSVAVGLRSVFGVFDGMGGLSDGETAAYVALRTFAEDVCTNGAVASVQRLSDICLKMSERVFAVAEENKCQMGAAAVLLACTQDNVLIANVGDCSIFRFGGADTIKVSVDHVEPSFGRKSSALSQYLGVPPYEFLISPHTAVLPLRFGDCYLLCSDGITSVLQQEDLHAVFMADTSPRAVAKELLRLAEERHCNDDATVIVVRIKKDE